jgi:hypothetical protein
MQPLDHPQWAALASEHARFARRLGKAAAYPPDVTPMSGLADAKDPQAWRRPGRTWRICSSPASGRS